MRGSMPSVNRTLVRLWSHIPDNRRRDFFYLFFLIIAASFMEMVSIGSVIPFLGALTAPTKIYEIQAMKPVIHVLGISSPDQLLFPLTIFFCLAAILAGAIRLWLLWASTQISFAVGADLSNSIYRRTLYQPYSKHISRNSSEVINGISGKANTVIYSAIMPSLILVSSTIMLTAILGTLLFIDPAIAIFSFMGFGAIYALITWLSRAEKIRNSFHVARESTQIIKLLQEGLGGIRDVLIDRSQEVFCKIYRDSDFRMRIAQGKIQFVSQSPRYGMEALGMVLIAILAYTLTQQSNGFSLAIPILGALALGAQRLLPIMQQAYASWSAIQGGQASLIDTLDLLDQPLPDYLDQLNVKPIKFLKSIHLNHIDFQYSVNTPVVIEGLNLTISKGSRVGFVGPTGCGKSTLIDIIMGLLVPTSGHLEIDGERITLQNQQAWYLHIAHVPQGIFLADSTVEENIAFGVPADLIDRDRVIQAAKQAQIADSIESWPEKYKTVIGERGVRLSGGQQQRIGIARALYKKADVIVLDEATSALDGETELAVMDAIDGLSPDLTIFIVAHRLTTLKNCSQIIRLNHGRIEEICNYSDLITSTH
jgi:ABC-type multidrug transport system fused ATPase/permease subunit